MNTSIWSSTFEFYSAESVATVTFLDGEKSVNKGS